jgi:hypothetical protein
MADTRNPAPALRASDLAELPARGAAVGVRGTIRLLPFELEQRTGAVPPRYRDV